MDLVPILSTVVLVATLTTLVLGTLSYLVFRMRERRRPQGEEPGGSPSGKRFLVRYRLDGGTTGEARES